MIYQWNDVSEKAPELPDNDKKRVSASILTDSFSCGWTLLAVRQFCKRQYVLGTFTWNFLIVRL